MDATEVETNERALEVTVIWGDNAVLRVDHLNAPRAYVVGEGDADVVIGAELLGTPRLELLSADGALAIPRGASGDVQLGDARIALHALIESGHAHAVGDGWSYTLPPFACARLHHRGFTFVVRSVRAGKVIGLHGGELDYRQQLWTALSFALHAVFLGAMYFMPPGASALSLETLSDDARLATYLMKPPEVIEATPDWLPSKDSGGDDGKRAAEDEGQAGKQNAPNRNTAHATAGHSQTKQLLRREELAQAKQAGILGALASARGAWDSPTSVFGADQPLGYDPRDAMGRVFGGELGEASGFGALGMRSTGRGGGGDGDGTIGIGKLGTVGHGGGGEGPGYGRGPGGFATRKSDVPRLRVGEADVRGSLSKEAIRRTIQRRLNEVRFCYEQELGSRPDLSGRVQVRFVVAPDGAVQAAAIASSTLGVSRAEACIAHAVHRWSFPAPDGGGVVIVTYPFVFDSAP
ncbi:MAG TPA: AgmX/PglI C-terminal domain-containing protein [Polyangiales bacterium]|nr:AgmX/PglI C-terminal domain-containing protein [Polyangiales bacterium]